MSIFEANCPTGCAFSLPVVDFDECSPSISFGEIEHLFIAAGDADPFGLVDAGWEDAAAWAARLSNTDINDKNKIRKFDVIGDLPAATKDILTISLGRQVVTPSTWTINVEVDDITDDNYLFAQKTGCNFQTRMWFATGDKLFGGNDGLLGNLNLYPTIERGQKSLHKLTGTFTWEASYAPERCDSPFAD